MPRQYTDAFLYGIIAKCAEHKVDPMKFAESLDRDRELSDYEDYADYCNDNSTGHGKRTCPGCDTTVNCRCPTKALKSNHEPHKLLCKSCFDGQVKEAGKGGDYGCAMVYFEDCGNALELWNQDMALIDIPEEDLHENGREDEPHVTVLYGIHTSDADKVKESLLKADIQECKFRMGGLGIFENDDFDVLIRHVDEISKLKELRDQLIEDLETTITFPDYKAHATIAYLKKGKGKEYLKKHKDTKWNLDQELESDTVDFSDKGTTHTKIKLNK